MNIFTKHPNQVKETYFKHMKKSLNFSYKLLLMSIQACIHAILPFLFETTVSDKIEEMNSFMQKRKKKASKSDF